MALALPEGPELAAALLSVACCAVCPLNPAYRAEEFGNYLTNLGGDLLIVQAGHDTAAREAAHALGLPILNLVPQPAEPAGVFALVGDGPPAVTDVGPTGGAGPEDVATLLQTSGTSARSKRVPLTHANLCAAACNIRRVLRLTAADRCLNVMPLFHIHGLSTLYATLAAGGSVVCPPGFLAPRFFEWMDAYRPTWWTASPTIHRQILERAAAHREVIARTPLRFIRSASAAMPGHLIADMERAFGVPFIEAYGMTEAGPQIASNPLPPGERKLRSAGRPAGPEVVILDDRGDALPSGTVGEVAIRGENVVRGYEGDPEANRAAFTGGWLRTGDQGYLDADGYLFITGRIKEIINRGGEKIAPREVEEVLLDHPAIAQAVCFGVPNPRLGEEVAAAVVLRPTASATEYELRTFVSARLADFKVPRQVAFVAAIPVTQAAKVQRIGMAAQLGVVAVDQAAAGPEADHQAPGTEVERALARIWADVLGIERVGAHDDFFRLGGDSILAIQILARVREALRVELGVLAFFEAPTLAGMARQVEAARSRPAETATSRIPPASRDGAVPLSHAQLGLWFADQLNPGNPVYNNYRAVRLTGPLEPSELERGLDEVVRRHEALRTSFHTTPDGEPVQAIAPAGAIPLNVVDLGGQAADGRLSADVRRLREEILRPFDLSRGPLLRATLYRLADREHVLLIVAHHIISDAWSMGLILTELAALYGAAREGRPSPLPAPAIHVADHAVWERRQLTGEALERLLSYWKGQLAGAPAGLDLPTDRPRPARQDFLGARQFRTLAQPLVEAVRTLCREQEVTLFMALLAAFDALLHAYTGQTDLVVGTHTAGRDRVETEGLVGDLTNTLVLRTRVSGASTFRELLARVRATTLGAYAHRDLPFGTLLEAVQPPRLPGRTPLFQVKFRLQNVPPPALEFAGLSATLLDLDYGMLKVDLGMELLERPEGLAGFIEYRTDLFNASTVERMWSDFEALLASFTARPDTALNSLDSIIAIAGRNRKMNHPEPGAAPAVAGETPSGSLKGLRSARRAAVSLSGADLVPPRPDSIRDRPSP